MFTVKIAAALFAVSVLVAGVGTESVREPGHERGPTLVTTCTTIADPGEYVLTRDVVSERYDCVRIESDGVVLDGGGHEITPSDGLRELGVRLAMPTPDHVGVGVRVGSTRPVAAVTVRNVRFVGLDVGVSVSNAENVRVSGIDAEDVATGILVTSSADVFVTDSVVVGSAEDGVVVRDSAGVVVADTTVEDGLVAGIVLESVEEGRLTRVRARGNDGDGLLVAESDGAALDSSRAEANGVGLLLMDSHGVAVTGLVAARNEFAGVGLVRSDGNRIRDVRVAGTTGRRPVLDAPSDLWLYASSGNCAENVSVEGGGGWVVYMRDGSTDNRVAELTDGLSSVSFVGSDVAVAFGDAPGASGRSSGGAPVVEPTGPAWSYDPATAACA